MSRSCPPRSAGRPAQAGSGLTSRLPAGGLALLDVRTERSLSVPWGERVSLGRGPEGSRHVAVPDDRVSRTAAVVEVRDDAYLIINRQRHGGLLTLFVPGVPGKDRIRTGNGLLVHDDRASLGLWLPDGQELTLALLRFAPAASAAAGGTGAQAGGGTVNTSLPTAQTWWSVLVAACGPTLIAAAESGSAAHRDVHGDAEQIAAWHRAQGLAAPSPKTQSEAFRHAQRWLRGLRLNDKTRGWRIAVVEQVIHLRLVTLEDVRHLFPAQVPAHLR